MFLLLSGLLALPQSAADAARALDGGVDRPSDRATRERGVFHFRRIIHLDANPAHFPVEVSADNHFILYVNGLRIGEGPAKGDLPDWRYEALDLAPALHPGDNVIAATVFNFGVYAPLAVISERTAFLMQGESAAESVVDTNPAWQVEQEPGEASSHGWAMGSC